MFRTARVTQQRALTAIAVLDVLITEPRLTADQVSSSAPECTPDGTGSLRVPSASCMIVSIVACTASNEVASLLACRALLHKIQRDLESALRSILYNDVFFLLHQSDNWSPSAPEFHVPEKCEAHNQQCMHRAKE